MTIDPARLAEVRDLYMNQNLNMKQIQAITGISYDRIRKECHGYVCTYN